MLEINKLNFTINKTVILSEVSFGIQKNQMVGIVGKNGTGKTTLFNAIYGKVKFNGQITLNNQRISKKDISYVESENRFYQFLTANEYLNFITDEKKSIKDKLIDLFDLPTDTYIENLSTGEKKKLALITGMLLDKEVNILDEPFNGLDIESVELLKILLKSNLFKDKIVIISSHILSSLTDICTEIIYLKNGKTESFSGDKNFDDLKQKIQAEARIKVNKVESLHKKIS